MLDKLKAPKGANKTRKRVGRGEASGYGKTSGRGHKGQKARSGGSVKAGFEGGQTPLHRRLPKRGFTNIFRTEYTIINLTDLKTKFAKDETVDLDTMKEKGLLKSTRKPIKILGNGDLDISLTVKANKFSETAKKKIEAAGGKAEVI